MKPDQKVIDRLVRRIIEAADPSRIILFGSASRETARPDSDLDVLVVTPEGTHRRKTAQDIYMNLLGFDHAVDLIVATEKDLQEHGDNFSLVYYPALREGKAIYVAPELQTRLT